MLMYYELFIFMYLGLLDSIVIDEDYFFYIGMVGIDFVWYWILVFSVDGVNSEDV